MNFIYRSIAIGCAALLVSCSGGTERTSPETGALQKVPLVSKVEVARPIVSSDIEFIQNLESRPHQSLNGAWARIIDPYENGYYNYRYQVHDNGFFKNQKVKTPTDLVEYDFDKAPKLNVPGDWNTQERELYYYEGTVWYQRYFDVKKANGQQYVLQFGAVNYASIIYVNGEKVGEHEGGFTSFQFDVTDFVKDGQNFIVLKVDNARARDQIPTVNTDWWNYGGITRSVFLAELPAAHIEDYTVKLSQDRTKIKGKIKLSNPVAATELMVSIPELGLQETLTPDANGAASFAWPASPELWTPETPKLYTVTLSYGADIATDQIGFRTVETQGTQILLNGKPVFMRGISIHEESLLHSGRAWSEADARATLTLAKELGTNFVRLAHYPHNETMLKMADEVGLMVWSEIPVYWTVLFEDAAVYAKAEKQLVEMITRDKNRASIVMWSVANETPFSEDRMTFLGRLITKARSLDSTRLMTAASDTHDGSEDEIVIQDPLADLIDVIGINSYCGWYWAKPEACPNKRWRSDYNKPIIMSEMGAGAKAGKFGTKNEIWTEEFQDYIYRQNLEMASHIEGLAGISPWILKDFRSPRRQLNGIQDDWNRKGLVSETGVKKKAWTTLKAYYEQKERAAP